MTKKKATLEISIDNNGPNAISTIVYLAVSLMYDLEDYVDFDDFDCLYINDKIIRLHVSYFLHSKNVLDEDSPFHELLSEILENHLTEKEFNSCKFVDVK